MNFQATRKSAAIERDLVSARNMRCECGARQIGYCRECENIRERVLADGYTYAGVGSNAAWIALFHSYR